MSGVEEIAIGSARNYYEIKKEIAEFQAKGFELLNASIEDIFTKAYKVSGWLEKCETLDSVMSDIYLKIAEKYASLCMYAAADGWEITEPKKRLEEINKISSIFAEHMVGKDMETKRKLKADISRLLGSKDLHEAKLRAVCVSQDARKYFKDFDEFINKVFAGLIPCVRGMKETLYRDFPEEYVDKSGLL